MAAAASEAFKVLPRRRATAETYSPAENTELKQMILALQKDLQDPVKQEGPSQHLPGVR